MTREQALRLVQATAGCDMPAADEVEIRISADGRRLWVNIDGRCALRVYNARCLVVNDSRQGGQ
jgi:hypothetical protein